MNIWLSESNLYLLIDRRNDLWFAFIRSSTCLPSHCWAAQRQVSWDLCQRDCLCGQLTFIHALFMSEDSSLYSSTASLSSDHENATHSKVDYINSLATLCDLFSLLSQFNIWLYTYLCVCLCMSLTVSCLFVEKEWKQDMQQMYREKSNESSLMVQNM